MPHEQLTFPPFAKSEKDGAPELSWLVENDRVGHPPSYAVLKVEAPDDIQVMRIELASLTDGWRDNSASSRARGDDWLPSRESALLEVPSAILPDTSNVLLNPHHADAGRVRVA